MIYKHAYFLLNSITVFLDLKKNVSKSLCIIIFNWDSNIRNITIYNKKIKWELLSSLKDPAERNL